jgi:hypothetical protein
MSGQRVKVLSERVEAIKNYPGAENVKGVHRFFGMAWFCERFIEYFSLIAEPLHALKRKNVKLVRGEAQLAAFK